MPSNDPVTFGVMLGPAYPWKEMAAQARQVEELGFDKVWLPDHFANYDQPEMDWYDCWTLLAGLAAVTGTVRLGTMVSSMTLRNPALLARMGVTVDHISGGRLELGVGAAGTRTCHEMTGVPVWDKGERSRRFREWVEIIDRMLTQPVTTYEGQFYQVKDAHLNPRPVQKPRLPLNIAAHGPKALKLAAQYGDAWNSFFPGKDLTPEQSSEVTRQRGQRVSECAAEAGRDPNAIRRTFLFGWTSDKPFASVEALRDAFGRYREAGIDDFIFFYLPGIPDSVWDGQSIRSEAQLEQVAIELLPEWRAAQA